MMPASWLIGGSALSIAAAAIGGFFAGKQAGEDRVHAQQLQQLEKQLSSGDALQNAIDLYERKAGLREQARAQEVRLVYRHVPRIVQADPVYRNVCLGADGLELLDRAAAAANGRAGTGEAAGGPGGAADGAADDRSGDRQGPR